MDGSYILLKSTGTLYGPNGMIVTLNDNFQWGDFGTALITLPATPDINNTINGTDQGWLDDPGDDFYDTSMEKRFFSQYEKKSLTSFC